MVAPADANAMEAEKGSKLIAVSKIALPVLVDMGSPASQANCGRTRSLDAAEVNVAMNDKPPAAGTTTIFVLLNMDVVSVMARIEGEKQNYFSLWER